MILILLLLASCATIEKKLEALFKAEYSTNLDERFSKTVEALKKEIVNFNLEKVQGSERIFYLKDASNIEKILSYFKGYNLELDIDNYIYKIPHRVRNIEFPETIIFNEKNRDAVIVSYDFKTKQFLEIFRIEDYNLTKFKIYSKVFKDLNGTTLLVLNEDLNYVDITPFKTRTSFCSAKIGFRKTDFFVNKGYITSFYTNRDVSGIYTAIYLDTTKNKYEIPLFNYLIKIIEDKINDHTGKYYSIYDFFFDEYEETPYFEKLKEHFFDTISSSIDLFESITYYHLGKYAALNPYDEKVTNELNKNLTKDDKEKMLINYDREVRATVEFVNNIIDKIKSGAGWSEIRWSISSVVRGDSRFKYIRSNINDLVYYILRLYEISILKND